MNERLNDRTNERSEFWQHNGREKIIWTNEQTMNDRTNDRTILVLVCACVEHGVGVCGGKRVAMKWLGVG
jgi:hypothetical protein